MNVIFLLIVTLLVPIQSRILFFGKTHSGKTTLINKCCGLDLPVAKEEQYHSTTREISEYNCLGNTVIDSIGIFDYQEEHSFGVKEILELILENINQNGISGIAWIWPSKESVANKDMEELFRTLNFILGNLQLPVVIVDNMFPHMRSGVPNHLANLFNLRKIQASKQNVHDLINWIKSSNRNFKLNLKDNWRELITDLDKEALKTMLLQSKQNVCDLVISRLENLKQAENNDLNCLICERDCSVIRKKCRFRVFVCLDSYVERYIDQRCLESIMDCRRSCENSNKSRREKLSAEYKQISEDYSHYLKLCDNIETKIALISERDKSGQKGNSEL